MYQEPDRGRINSVEAWWEGLDLKAPLDSDHVMSYYLEALSRRSKRDSGVPVEEVRAQSRLLATRLDLFIDSLLELECNRSVSYLGRFVSDIRLYESPTGQFERRGLVELRDDRGRNLTLAGDRLRPLRAGFGALELTLTGNEDYPTSAMLISPRAYAAELDLISKILKTPIGQSFLESNSPLYCLMRESIATNHKSDYGWDSEVQHMVPTWAGEASNFLFYFENGGKISVHPRYHPDRCEIVIRTKEL
ncbi:MAG: hypothetical protein RL417_404 [Pseudomonadota bacterium]|jgi:hypothetical protein